MKIIVASTIVPFINGGGRLIVDWLASELRKQGHDVEQFNIPFISNYREILPQMLSLRTWDFTDQCDLLICIRTPSYLIRHPKKRLWFIHHHRTAYDLWDSHYREIEDSGDGWALRESLYTADNLALRESDRVFTNSKIISRRLKEFNNVDSQVLYPPLNQPEAFHSHSYGDYLYFCCRITHHKRQHLAIEALKYTKTPVRVVIEGAPESAPYLDSLKAMIHEHKLEDRVVLNDQWISEEHKIEQLSNCLAAIYAPLDEDSYGYPSLEAHAAEKCVISCTDSGGVEELIRHEHNGFLLPPDPGYLAEVFDRLYLDRKLAEKMGKNGKRVVEELNISWGHIVTRMTE